MIDLFQYGDFKSHAGLSLRWKIECDGISDKEWECISEMILDYEKRPFFKAIGIPRGGEPLARKLDKYASNNSDDSVLVVDDVYTTGTSFKNYISQIGYDYPYNNFIKWVVFARQATKDNINALFTMPEKR